MVTETKVLPEIEEKAYAAMEAPGDVPVFVRFNETLDKEIRQKPKKRSSLSVTRRPKSITDAFLT